MDAEWNRRYARLIVGPCLGVGEGSRLRIFAEIAHRDLVRAVAAEAYERGAREVRVDYEDPVLARIRADGSADGWLDSTSLPLARLASAYAEERWSNLSLVGEETPGLMEGADPARLGRALRANRTSFNAYRQMIMGGKVAWCVAPSPTAGWARAILPPALLADREPEAALAEVLTPILRLDASDPAAAWLSHIAALEGRVRSLGGLGLRALRFSGPGTELRAGLSSRSRWVGGGSRLADGAFYTPNIPTEEVFTTPDARLTEGRVSCTRPVEVLGAKVEGAWFEFAAGRVERFGASRNASSLERYLATDPGARRLGEVALVDSSGPIAASGLVFDNGLIDENAACHVALGSGYAEAFEGVDPMDAEARAAAGFNESLVHVDFMIGSDEIEVTGEDSSGRAVPLLSRGRFVL